MKKLIVPQSDLDALAEARFLLFEILEDNKHLVARITNGVSDVMYRISHNKYPVWEPQAKREKSHICKSCGRPKIAGHSELCENRY